MSMKQRKKNSLVSNPGLQCATLREENVGRKNVSSSSILRMQHLQRLAIWASGEGSIPPLGALLGRQLANEAEAEGIPLDRSILSCQRCETILQPGYNCAVRIEKNTNGTKHRRKSGKLQNNVVYACHFCSHRNLRKGTPRGYMKDLLASRARFVPEPNHLNSMGTTITESDKDVTLVNEDVDSCNKSVIVSGSLPISRINLDKEVVRDTAEDSPRTPSDKLSGKKMKLMGTGSFKAANGEPSDATTGSGKGSKRRRKGWSGLREITLSSEQEKEQRMNNLAIPFLM